MASPEENLLGPSRADFCHPYEPYDIQLRFMEALYECLEERQIGIFESPTGTGKSLSLICGSLTWLRDHEKRSMYQKLGPDDADDDDPPWMVEAALGEKRKALYQARQDLETKLRMIREREEKQIQRQQQYEQKQKRHKTSAGSQVSLNDSDDQFALAEYESEDERAPGKRRAVAQDGLSAGTATLLETLLGPRTNDPEEQTPIETRIFYCSRTHSQLTQFVNELRRVKLPSSAVPDGSVDTVNKEANEPLKHISLGSRKNLCINPKVLALKNNSLINERCREMQKPGIPSEQKCNFLPAKEEVDKWADFRNHAIARVRDIEDLGKLGQKLGICPYYASRSTILSSEMVTLPYPLLLQKSARETMKLALKNQVIIIDEAHNLMDAIANANSTSITLDSLSRSTAQLTAYVQAYRRRLKGKNRVYVTQIIRLLHSISSCANGKLQLSPKKEQIVSTSDLMAGKGVDQINPHKLSMYLQESKLALKVSGFTEHMQKKDAGSNDQLVKTEDLTTVQSFLLSLMNPSAEGIIFLSPSEHETHLRYSLLEPKNHFRDIVEDARAVILAGGTMSPMSDYADYLFPYLPSERLSVHSFGHVIPPTNLIALSLSMGSTGTEFEFTFGKRNAPSMMAEIGSSLFEVCQIVPDGVVVFFPSYDYLKQVVAAFKTTYGSQTSLFERINSTKPIFWESKDSTQTHDLFSRYSISIDEGRGGLLLSVVGGKLSEGINFSDKLGRAVIIIGLPFPNIQSAEWKAKIAHIEHIQGEQLGLAEPKLPKVELDARAKASGRDFYENACMRAVNQCIGRAIRHRNDYAAIILMDKRYKTPRIHNKLPTWIRQSMTAQQDKWTFQDVKLGLTGFFSGKT